MQSTRDSEGPNDCPFDICVILIAGTLMDAFESIVATLLMRDGFWVQTSLKVNLTAEDKLKIDRKTSPRWELDVVAYRPGDNLLRVVECKSYLDSGGVSMGAFDSSTRFSNRFKLFNEPDTREVVLKRLVAQMIDSKAICENPTIKLCLAAGRVVNTDAGRLREHCAANDWLLFDHEWLESELHKLAEDGYENAVAAVTAKLLLRNQQRRKT